jgi:hypothetical protein
MSRNLKIIIEMKAYIDSLAHRNSRSLNDLAILYKRFLIDSKVMLEGTPLDLKKTVYAFQFLEE